MGANASLPRPMTSADPVLFYYQTCHESHHRPKPAARKTDAMTKLVTASLRSARSDAVKTAHMHRTPVVYLENGKIINERP